MFIQIHLITTNISICKTDLHHIQNLSTSQELNINDSQLSYQSRDSLQHQASLTSSYLALLLTILWLSLLLLLPDSKSESCLVDFANLSATALYQNISQQFLWILLIRQIITKLVSLSFVDIKRYIKYGELQKKGLQIPVSRSRARINAFPSVIFYQIPCALKILSESNCKFSANYKIKFLRERN